MDRNNLPWWSWLTTTSASIRKTHPSFSSAIRYDAIGHKRALSVRWALSVGMWGGIYTKEQIFETVRPGTELRYTEFLRSWKVRARVDRKLWPAGSVRRVELAQRACALFKTTNQSHSRGDSLRAVGSALHILPVEVAVMLDEAHRLDVLDTDAVDYWESEDAKTHWGNWDPVPRRIFKRWLQVQDDEQAHQPARARRDAEHQRPDSSA